MKVYIIDYKTVGAEGVREIEQGVDGDAVFFVTGDPTNLPVQINSILDNAVKESYQRVSSSLQCFGYKIPGKKIIINIVKNHTGEICNRFYYGKYRTYKPHKAYDT